MLKLLRRKKTRGKERIHTLKLSWLPVKVALMTFQCYPLGARRTPPNSRSPYGQLGDTPKVFIISGRSKPTLSFFSSSVARYLATPKKRLAVHREKTLVAFISINGTCQQTSPSVRYESLHKASSVRSADTFSKKKRGVISLSFTSLPLDGISPRP